MYALTDYNYDLPSELIAQKPASRRDQANLLALDRGTAVLSHHQFSDLETLLNPGDVLVINNTAVIPGRLLGKKETGGKVEVLIADFTAGCESIQSGGDFICECLIKAAKRPKPGIWLYFDKDLKGEVIESHNGTHTVKFHTRGDFETRLNQVGKVPLPPYIKRRPAGSVPCDDRLAYQTVYASQKGAIAAPTAGLHFTPELLETLAAGGVTIAAVTLHVGYGTFLPVRVSDIRRHKMHAERFSISAETAETLNSARRTRRRIVAVGTTCVRTLEYVADADGNVAPGSGACDLFIYPGYRFNMVDAMITNFHLPQSTLLMLVAAFAGRDQILQAYAEAIKQRYRFYSYGDAMLIT
jgi:S-adenosylmethionine:tRNA ribosyltransferase-isomerase